MCRVRERWHDSVSFALFNSLLILIIQYFVSVAVATCANYHSLDIQLVTTGGGFHPCPCNQFAACQLVTPSKAQDLRALLDVATGTSMISRHTTSRLSGKRDLGFSMKEYKIGDRLDAEKFGADICQKCKHHATSLSQVLERFGKS